MTTAQEHADWLAHPTGKIGKGEYCSTCSRFNARNIASDVILLDGTKVLLVKRGEEPDKGWWDIPGGYLDWDQTLEESSARELLEETSLVVKPEDLELLQVYSNPENKAQNQVIDIYYVARIFSGEVHIDGEEIVAAQWFDLKNLPETVAFDHRSVLEQLQKNLNL